MKKTIALFISLLLSCVISVNALALTIVNVIPNISSVKPNESTSTHSYSSYWQYWSQGASAYPDDTSSGLRNMRKWGCRLVAQSKLLVEAGLASSNPSIFNPDIYFAWTVDGGYQNASPWEHSVGAAVIQWGKEKGTTIKLTSEPYNSVQQVMNYIRNGYYVIMGCDAHHAYIGREASLNYGSPVVLDSGSWTSCNAELGVALEGYNKAPFDTVYCYTVGRLPGKLNVSATLDGVPQDTLGQFGTFDMYIDQQLVANDVNAFNKSYTSDVSYTLTDVKAKPGYDYLGITSGSAQGTITAGSTVNIQLKFARQGNLLVQGLLDGITASSSEGYGTFDVYINGTLDESGCTGYNKKWPNGTTFEIRNIQPLSQKNYHAENSSGLSGTITSSKESKAILAFTSDGTATTEWQIGKVLPGNLNPDELDIQYEHIYLQTGRTSPGDGWEMIAEGAVQYENNGAAYNSDNPLETSATRVQVGRYYFHWCGNPNDVNHANYYQRPGVLDTYHTISADQIGYYEITSQNLDGDRYYYTLKNLTGEWAGGQTTCPYGCKYYYEGYVYQNKSPYKINTYQKLSGWVDAFDSSATDWNVRWRYKDGVLPVPPEEYVLTINGCLDGVQADNTEKYATFDLYIDGEIYAQSCTGIRATFDRNIIYDIRNIKPAIGKKYDGLIAGKISGDIPNGKATVTLSFSTVIDINENWTEIETLPDDLDLTSCDIEYKNHYITTGRTSPGAGWTMIAEGAVQYENDGSQYESDNELPTSEKCVLVGYYYFHWCNNGENANYYQKDYLPIKHTIPMSSVSEFIVEEKGTDGDGSGRKFYYLTHKTGEYAGGIAQCGPTGSCVYYRGGVYQNKKAYRINTYSMTSEWTTALDPEATSVEYRIRLKQYDVLLDGNGSATTTQLSKVHDMPLDLSAYIPAREDYSFVGWNTAMDGSRKQYDAGYIYTENEPLVLYAQWRALPVITLPAGTKVIEKEAFAGSHVMIVRIPNGCESIQEKAFEDCEHLVKIFIPSTVTYISASAFDGLNSLTIVGENDSYAELYTHKHSWITFISAE